jgi:DNA polymerase
MKIDDLEDLFGPISEVLASCIRHFIELDGEQFLDADYKMIEATITPWLCGQADMMDEFRRGEDVYKTTSAAVFNIPVSRVTKEQRFLGKVLTLSCQFGTGWRKFRSSCAKAGYDIPRDVCQQAVRGYREKRDKIVEGWRSMEDAASAAIRSSGKYFEACRARFRYGRVGGFPALQMELPSGHKLTYPHARIKKVIRRFQSDDDDDKWYEVEKDEIQYWGKAKATQNWVYQGTWGSVLLENCTQAVGGDFLTHGMLNAEQAQYGCFATIHDQVLCVKEPHHDVEEFRRLLCTLPAWAEGFPLDASAAVMPWYSKD